VDAIAVEIDGAKHDFARLLSAALSISPRFEVIGSHS